MQLFSMNAALFCYQPIGCCLRVYSQGLCEVLSVPVL